MKSFEEVTPVSVAQTTLMTELMEKGMDYAGSGMKDGERCLELKSEGNELVIHPVSGKVELFTEFLDPSDPSDVGNHVWTIQPDATPAEIEATVAAITAITGDN